MLLRRGRRRTGEEGGEAGLYEGARKKAVELNLKELEFHRLDRLRAQNEKLYAVLLEQLKEADLRRMMNTNNIRIIDTPTEPKTPIAPRVTTNVGIGFLTGVLLGIVLALLREALDNTMKTPEDVEKRFNVTFLGLLPEIAEDDPDTLVYAARNRLYVSRDGGIFWNALELELPEIHGLAITE